MPQGPGRFIVTASEFAAGLWITCRNCGTRTVTSSCSDATGSEWPSQDEGHHAMPRKQTREDNLIELAARRERKVELGRTDRTPKRACSYLDQAADVETTSALDQLLSILDGRRGH